MLVMFNNDIGKLSSQIYTHNFGKRQYEVETEYLTLCLFDNKYIFKIGITIK